jgi:rSAM/selenodomain-associated transferase 2/rSAM/selenodomain-associated transferase 1
MRNGYRISTIIPALNEERSLGKVLTAIPPWIDDVIVADNGSTDRTQEVALSHGARVVHEPRRGYGSACLAAMAELDCPDIVLFMDGDFSDHPDEADLLVDPIIAGNADMVLGSRVLGDHEPGALTPQAIFGNWLACKLIDLFWGVTFTDLGPFRAIRYNALQRLHMRDPDYGWTVEMQIKAARLGLSVLEVPVSYRPRVGKSKVSGTVKGVIGAGTKILGTIFLAASGLLPVPEDSCADERLIIFSRYPVPGNTKTRLIPLLGAEAAADLHRRMTEFTLHKMRDLAIRDSLGIEVYFAGGDASVMKEWLGDELVYRDQGNGDLGSRMLHAFRDAFQDGAERTVIIGTDCPALSSAIVQRAFTELGRHDLVLGPARDGGYYLIGAQRPLPELFSGVAWGTGEVLQTTLGIADRVGLSVALLDQLDDVDQPADLHVWENAMSGESASRCIQTNGESRVSVSVIIPTRNEEEHIQATLDVAQAAEDVEIIVVDGGSSDHTVELAQDYGVNTCESSGGRSGQMNAGAKRASGEILLFLHADTLLPVGWREQVIRALESPDVSGGAFRLRVGSDLLSLRIIEALANFRSSRLRLPYGDQAIFLRRDIFLKIGGFSNIPIMEDVELVHKLRKLGRLTTLSIPVVTSDRRWRHYGVWKTTLLNQLLILGYMCRVPIDSLARLYQKGRL